MANVPKKIEVPYNIIIELFRLANISYSELPTEDDLQNLLITIKSKLASGQKGQDTIKNLFSIDPSDHEITTTGKEASILVVDDLVMVTYQLSILLSKLGYKVTLARSAPEALSFFKSNYYSYVLMDLHMPEKNDGLFLLQTLRSKILKEHLSTKIIVMSGMADNETIEFLLANGATSFIEKDENWKREILNCINKV